MTPERRKALVEQLVDFIRSSTVRGGDKDWYLGFKADTPVEETERDPKTGKIVNNTEIGDHSTFLQQWDTRNVGYLEGEERDSGTYSYRLQKLESKKELANSKKEATFKKLK